MSESQQPPLDLAAHILALEADVLPAAPKLARSLAADLSDVLPAAPPMDAGEWLESLDGQRTAFHDWFKALDASRQNLARAVEPEYSLVRIETYPPDLAQRQGPSPVTPPDTATSTSPPDGWEGVLPHRPIRTEADFIWWLDFVIECKEKHLPFSETGGEVRKGNSDGRSLRNAHRLIDALDLRGMPPQRTGTLTFLDEVGELRNLRRVCRERQPISPAYEARAGAGQAEADRCQQPDPAAATSTTPATGAERAEGADQSRTDDKPAAEKKRKRAGRPKVFDQKTDEKLAMDWLASNLSSVKDFARERGLPLQEVKRTLERHRARTRRREG